MDARRFSPASERNREPILEVLRLLLPETGTVLELGSGSGQHAAYFAKALPALQWQPSDKTAEGFDSVAAWAESESAANVRPPVVLDVTSDQWPVENVEAVYSANVIHISPWDVCLGLMRGAGRCLGPGGVLVLYGPFRIGGEHTAESNAEFDQSLRSRDPSWGIRDLEAVADAAEASGFDLEARVPMPANNQTLVFKRR